MKRKLALLLAAVMTLSMLPMNVFAKSDNSVSTTITSAADNTLLRGPGSTYTISSDVKESINGDTIVGTVKDGMWLTIKASDAITSKQGFELELTNAEWFFKSSDDSIVSPGTLTADLLSAAAAAGVITSDDEVDYSGVDTTYKGVSMYNYGSGSSYAKANNSQWIVGNSSSYTLNFDGVYMASGAGIGARSKAYAMAVRPWPNSNTAVVRALEGVASSEYIDIPLAIRTIDESLPVTVRISTNIGNAAPVSTDNLTVVQGVQGATVTTIAGKANGRKYVDLDVVTIKETRPGVIKDTSSSPSIRYFYIDAPTGYRFIEGSNNWGTAKMIGFTGTNPAAAIDSYPTSGADNSRVLRVAVSGYNDTGSSNVLGSIQIADLRVEAISSNTWGEFSGLAVRDSSGNTESGISDYTFGVVGTRADWGVTLTAADSKEGVPSLYTGVISKGAINLSGDKSYKVMKVTLEENAIGSWWTERETKLTFPEGVLVRAVEITDTDNIKTVSTNKVIDKGHYRDRYSDNDSATGSGRNSSGEFWIDGRSIVFGDIKAETGKKVSVTMNVWVSISNRMGGQDITMSVTGGGMAEDNLPEPLVVAHAVAPVTVETKVTTVGIGRNAQSSADIIITETNAGALVEDKTIVLQVVDQYGNGFRASAVDYIDFTYAEFEVTEGDLEIDGSYDSGSGSATYTGGYIGDAGNVLTIDIDAESRTASTITISNVKVRTSTLLSTYEKDAYKVAVFGSAIAENYDTRGNDVYTDGWRYGGRGGYFSSTLKDAGLFADYINVSSAVTVGGFDPEARFVITTDPAKGDMYYEINDVRLPIPADMSPRNENGVVLLSVRLVAEAFGCQVDWDPLEGRAIVSLGSNKYAEFTAGSSYISVNGTRLLMAYDSGQLATADIYDERMFVPVRFLGQALGVADSNITYEDGVVYFNRR